MNTCKNKQQLNNGLSVAITCPPTWPSLARAQQQASALLLIAFICSEQIIPPSGGQGGVPQTVCRLNPNLLN